MKVILISKIPRFGNIGDIIDVKDGYGRYLISSKKAICYSAANYKSFAERKKQFETENKENIVNANKIKNQIGNQDIIIIENASDDGRLYGSVNTNSIASQINKALKVQLVSRTNILLTKPIKDTGVYNIIIDLHSDVQHSLRLIVSRNKSEVQNLIKEFENQDNAKKAEQKAEKKAKDKPKDKAEVSKSEETIAKADDEEDKKDKKEIAQDQESSKDKKEIAKKEVTKTK